MTTHQFRKSVLFAGFAIHKLLLPALLLFVTASLLAGCSSKQEAAVVSSASGNTGGSVPASVTADTVPEAAAPIRIAGLKGPTSMGMVKLMADADAGITENSYSFSLHGSADEVTPKLIQGQLDMAALPANLAAVLYNNTEGALKVLAVNTLGVLYIVEKGNSIASITDLKGKTVYATGKGSTPEYTLRALLQANSIDPDSDVTIEFKSEPAEAVSLLASGNGTIAMLPQPYVTAAAAKVEGLRTAIDLTKAWEDTGESGKLITGVLVARSDFIEKNPEAVNTFLKEYAASVDWVLSNTAEAAAYCETYDIAKAQIAQKALPACNITFLSGSSMKAALSGYLETLFDQNPKAVGGKLPDNNFYYNGSV